MNIIKNFSILSLVVILVVSCEASEKSDQSDSNKTPEYLGFWELEFKTEKNYNAQGLHYSHDKKGSEILEITSSKIRSFNYPYQHYYSTEYILSNSTLYFTKDGQIIQYSIQLPSSDTLILTESKKVNGDITREEEIYRYHKYNLTQNFLDTIKILEESTYNKNYFRGEWEFIFSAIPSQYDKRFTKAFQTDVYDPLDSSVFNHKIPMDSLLQFKPIRVLDFSNSESFDLNNHTLKYITKSDTILFSVTDFDGESIVLIPTSQCYCDSIVMWYGRVKN